MLGWDGSPRAAIRPQMIPSLFSSMTVQFKGTKNSHYFLGLDFAMLTLGSLQLLENLKDKKTF